MEESLETKKKRRRSIPRSIEWESHESKKKSSRRKDSFYWRNIRRVYDGHLCFGDSGTDINDLWSIKRTVSLFFFFSQHTISQAFIIIGQTKGRNQRKKHIDEEDMNDAASLPPSHVSKNVMQEGFTSRETTSKRRERRMIKCLECNEFFVLLVMKTNEESWDTQNGQEEQDSRQLKVETGKWGYRHSERTSEKEVEAWKTKRKGRQERKTRMFSLVVHEQRKELRKEERKSRREAGNDESRARRRWWWGYIARHTRHGEVKKVILSSSSSSTYESSPAAFSWDPISIELYPWLMSPKGPSGGSVHAEKTRRNHRK